MNRGYQNIDLAGGYRFGTLNRPSVNAVEYVLRSGNRLSETSLQMPYLFNRALRAVLAFASAISRGAPDSADVSLGTDVVRVLSRMEGHIT